MSHMNNEIATQPPSSPESLNKRHNSHQTFLRLGLKPSDEALRILRLFKPKRIGTDKSNSPTIKGNKLPDGVKPVPEVPLEKISLD